MYLSDGGLSGLNECLRRPDGVTLIEMANWAPLAIKCCLKDIIPADLVRTVNIYYLLL